MDLVSWSSTAPCFTLIWPVLALMTNAPEVGGLAGQRIGQRLALIGYVPVTGAPTAVPAGACSATERVSFRSPVPVYDRDT